MRPKEIPFRHDQLKGLGCSGEAAEAMNSNSSHGQTDDF